MFRRAEFRLAAFLLALVATAALIHGPVQAQFRGGYAFLQAVESRDGTKATEALNNDNTLINTRHPESGETALAIVAKRRDATWLRFLLAKDADPAIADRQGMTPLMHAALLNFTDGAQELLDAKAPVDQTNRRGETALILAVQTKNVAMVRLLMRSGANPDKADHTTGMSARAYAKRDDRTGQLITILDAKVDGPGRDLGPSIGPN
ncbi:ankyrin repeat domain-containing protein [Sphingopyxis sp.]|jgi:ankyrin repeat protein|uniref:ankyrin repeat domain-containing protein n=1 Tax=Sphingopyxis sp. TaxID=1908224 RepID=UPI0025EEEEDD|nr:ankyrin repeat domain-containing protein [Sphingopyxis sp.]MBK6412282.1 ankyrin repeat domain-containing protein [Sphingopyxis sp.]